MRRVFDVRSKKDWLIHVLVNWAFVFGLVVLVIRSPAFYMVLVCFVFNSYIIVTNRGILNGQRDSS